MKFFRIDLLRGKSSLDLWPLLCRSIGYRLLITGHGLLHAGLTLVNAPIEHPKEGDDRIFGP
jgi:hypothetical protein